LRQAKRSLACPAHSRPCKWSVTLLTAAGSFARTILLPIVSVTGLAAALLALRTGIYAIVRRRERSVLVRITAGIGLLALFFLLGEFLGPAH
jgi:hypothetical protein